MSWPTGLTITMVVVQLAMGQFSPGSCRRSCATSRADRDRAVHRHLRPRHADPREVHVRGESVPGLAIAVATCWCWSASRCWCSTCTTSASRCGCLRLIELVGSDTRRLLDGTTRREGDGAARRRTDDPRHRIGWSCRDPARRAGRGSAGADCQLTMVPALRRVRRSGAPLFRVDGRQRRSSTPTRCSTFVVLGLERTVEHDVAYGFRMLVDMARRSRQTGTFGLLRRWSCHRAATRGSSSPVGRVRATPTAAPTTADATVAARLSRSQYRPRRLVR